jgi:hypothetical protein
VHWGGRCREIDAMTFEPLSVETMPAWPIAKSDLDPCQAEIDDILDLPPDRRGPRPALKNLLRA